MARPTSRVSRVLMTGSLAPYETPYSRELRKRGYTRRSSVNELRQVARLSRWLGSVGLTAADLSSGRIEEFLEFQHRTGRFGSQWSRPGLRCLLDVLWRMGVAPMEPTVSVASPREALLGRFERYELAERGLATGTVGGMWGMRAGSWTGSGRSSWPRSQPGRCAQRCCASRRRCR